MRRWRGMGKDEKRIDSACKEEKIRKKNKV